MPERAVTGKRGGTAKPTSPGTLKHPWGSFRDLDPP